MAFLLLEAVKDIVEAVDPGVKEGKTWQRFEKVVDIGAAVETTAAVLTAAGAAMVVSGGTAAPLIAEGGALAAEEGALLFGAFEAGEATVSGVEAVEGAEAFMSLDETVSEGTSLLDRGSNFLERGQQLVEESKGLLSQGSELAEQQAISLGERVGQGENVTRVLNIAKKAKDVSKTIATAQVGYDTIKQGYKAIFNKDGEVQRSLVNNDHPVADLVNKDGKIDYSTTQSILGEQHSAYHGDSIHSTSHEEHEGFIGHKRSRDGYIIPQISISMGETMSGYDVSNNSSAFNQIQQQDYNANTYGPVTQGFLFD